MSRGRAITLTIAAWAVIAGLYAGYYVKSILALPDLRRGYESDWQFQLLMFCLFRLPILVIGLAATLVFEIAAFKSKNRPEN